MTLETPGRPPASVAKCRPGLPTAATLMCSHRFLWIASRPKNVKNRLASLVKLLHRDAGGLAEHPDRRTRALLRVFGPHEFDDLPVGLGQLVDPLGLGDLGRHLLGPLNGVLEEAFVVDLDGAAGERGNGHT